MAATVAPLTGFCLAFCEDGDEDELETIMTEYALMTELSEKLNRFQEFGSHAAKAWATCG